MPPVGEEERREEEREIDVKEKQKIETYLREGCGCAKQCSSQFDESFLVKMRSDCAELTHQELDLLVMGQLLAVVNLSQETSAMRHLPHPRQKMYSQFMLGSKKVGLLFLIQKTIYHNH